jgi:hypothetical protein
LQRSASSVVGTDGRAVALRSISPRFWVFPRIGREIRWGNAVSADVRAVTLCNFLHYGPHRRGPASHSANISQGARRQPTRAVAKALDGNETPILTVEVIGETARVHHVAVWRSGMASR